MPERCKCGKQLTEYEIKLNQEVADKANSRNLGMCEDCWSDYCHHVETGE